MSHINTLQVVLDRLGCADPATGDFFFWDEVKDWPAGALDLLVANGLLQPAQPAAAIECDGCEDNCINKPVVVYPAQDDKPGRAFIVCDERDYIGRVRVDFRRMEQWQATGGLIAAALARLLGLSQPSKTADDGQWHIGTIKGRKHNSPVTLLAGDSLTLVLAGHTVPLMDVLTIEENNLTLDKAALIRLVDNPADKSEIEKPEARKARLTARVNAERVKGTKAFLQVVAKEEGFDVSRLKQIIYDYPKTKSAATPTNPWGELQQTSSKKPKTKY